MLGSLLILTAAFGGALVAFRREIASAYGEITHPDGSHEVWGTKTGELAKWATVGACAFLGGGGALGLAIMGARSAAGTASGGFVYSAPNQPTGSVVVIDTSTVYFLASAFVGSGNDTQDSVRFAVTRLGADTTSILTEVKTATVSNARDTISDQANLKADTTYKGWFKYSGVNGNWSAWSAPDTFVNRVDNPLFFDDFDSCDFSYTENGFAWSNRNTTSVVTPAETYPREVDNGDAYTGRTCSLVHRYYNTPADFQWETFVIGATSNTGGFEAVAVNWQQKIPGNYVTHPAGPGYQRKWGSIRTWGEGAAFASPCGASAYHAVLGWNFNNGPAAGYLSDSWFLGWACPYGTDKLWDNQGYGPSTSNNWILETDTAQWIDVKVGVRYSMPTAADSTGIIFMIYNGSVHVCMDELPLANVDTKAGRNFGAWEIGGSWDEVAPGETYGSPNDTIEIRVADPKFYGERAAPWDSLPQWFLDACP